VIKNAVKFTPEGGEISVATRMRENPARFVLTVTDSGIGMTAPELARVFDAFVQGDHSGGQSEHRFGGLGLGLAISRMLTELHGGTIRAASEGRDRGSTFVVELPLTVAPEGATAAGKSFRPQEEFETAERGKAGPE